MFRLFTFKLTWYNQIKPTIFVMFSIFLLLFFVPSFSSTLFLPFVVFSILYYFIFSLPQYISYTYIFFLFYSVCPRVCNVYLQLIQVHFQITLYYLTDSISTYNHKIILIFPFTSFMSLLSCISCICKHSWTDICTCIFIHT